MAPEALPKKGEEAGELVRQDARVACHGLGRHGLIGGQPTHAVEMNDFRGKVDIGAWNAVFRQVTERSVPDGCAGRVAQTPR